MASGGVAECRHKHVAEQREPPYGYRASRGDPGEAWGVAKW